MSGISKTTTTKRTHKDIETKGQGSPKVNEGPALSKRKLNPKGENVPPKVLLALRKGISDIKQSAAEALYDQGKCFLKIDYAKAIDYFMPAAAQGHIQAQVALGLLYALGKVVGDQADADRADYVEAIKYFILAAAQGDINAQAHLGQLYTNGRVVGNRADPNRIDYAEAIKYFICAAAQGDINAQRALGQLYSMGKVVGNQADPNRADYAEAIKYYTLAADQGDINAQANLGRLYATGRVVGNQMDPDRVNYAEAIKYFMLAATQGNGRAQMALGELYTTGGVVGNQMDPDRVNYAEAIKYFMLAAAQGNGRAQMALGELYTMGGVVGNQMDPDRVNFAEAIKYYTLAEAQENSDAQLVLAQLYATGRVVGNRMDLRKVDSKKSIFFYKKCASASADIKIMVLDLIRSHIRSVGQRSDIDFYSYHYAVLNNPNFIKEAIKEESLHAIKIKTIIKGLLHHEKGFMSQDHVFKYLLEILKKEPSYFDEIMRESSIEDKERLAREFMTPEDLASRYRVMQTIIDDPNTSPVLKLQTQFDLNYEVMNSEREKLMEDFGTTTLDELCLMKEAFPKYQRIFQVFRPIFLELIRKATLGDAKAIDKMSELKHDFEVKLGWFNTSYQKYKDFYKSAQSS